MPVTATAIAQTASQVVNTVSQIGDMKKRREVEAALARLSTDEQIRLNRKVADAQNATQRLAILLSEVNRLEVERIKASAGRDTQFALAAIGGAFLLLFAAIYFAKS